MQPVILPRDERPHHDRWIEWWYFIGHLRPVEAPTHLGYTIGFIVLRATLVAQGWVSFVLFVDHSAGVHPVRKAIPLFRRTFAPDGQVGFRFEFPGGVHPDRTWMLEASHDLHYSLRLNEHGAYTIDLDVEPGPAYLLGVQGIVDYGQSVELAYYVRPHLNAKGRIRPDGRDAIDVAGHMWLERQWGNENVNGVRWKYLLVHRSDAEQWIFFRLQHRGGARSEMSYGCRMKSGSIDQLPQGTVEIQDVGSGPGIGLGSRVLVRSRGIDLVVEPLFGNDQWYRPGLLPPFFEGASRVTGTIAGGEVDCWGMTEVANYRAPR